MLVRAFTGCDISFWLPEVQVMVMVLLNCFTSCNITFHTCLLDVPCNTVSMQFLRNDFVSYSSLTTVATLLLNGSNTYFEHIPLLNVATSHFKVVIHS